MTWQPIETAPTGQVVEMGGWDDWGCDKRVWRTQIGVAYDRVCVVFSVKRHGPRMTHWRYLPEPPEGA